MCKRKGHPKADLYYSERMKGLALSEIAAKYGVSYQAVAQGCARCDPSRFKPYTAEEVVYTNLRRWLNDNKVSRKEFVRRLGVVPYGEYSNRISDWFRGKYYPSKPTIDRILNITGLTYEELWRQEERNDQKRDT